MWLEVLAALVVLIGVSVAALGAVLPALPSVPLAFVGVVLAAWMVGFVGLDVEFIVWDLVQNRYISASSELAEVIQGEVSRALGLPDRGVRQAGFRVLVGAWMPAVLVEMGFLTHPEDARLLRTDRYQRNLARALGDAILVYRDRVARSGAAMAREGDR